MGLGGIIELILLGLTGVVLLSVVLAALRFAHGPRKGSYRYSWFEKE